MTITISRDFLLYFLLFFVIVFFGVLYMAQAEHISQQQQMVQSSQSNVSNHSKQYVRNHSEQHTNQVVNGNEVIGIVK